MITTISEMTSTSSTILRRAVVLLGGTAIALLAMAVPAIAEPALDGPITTSPSTEMSPATNVAKKKPRPAPVLSEILVTKDFDKSSP
jgi:hypothetical protein